MLPVRRKAKKEKVRAKMVKAKVRIQAAKAKARVKPFQLLGPRFMYIASMSSALSVPLAKLRCTWAKISLKPANSAKPTLFYHLVTNQEENKEIGAGGGTEGLSSAFSKSCGAGQV